MRQFDKLSDVFNDFKRIFQENHYDINLKEIDEKIYIKIILIFI